MAILPNYAQLCNVQNLPPPTAYHARMHQPGGPGHEGAHDADVRGKEEAEGDVRENRLEQQRRGQGGGGGVKGRGVGWSARGDDPSDTGKWSSGDGFKISH